EQERVMSEEAYDDAENSGSASTSATPGASSPAAQASGTALVFPEAHAKGTYSDGSFSRRQLLASAAGAALGFAAGWSQGERTTFFKLTAQFSEPAKECPRFASRGGHVPGTRCCVPPSCVCL